jgi:exodeoxyribonuclease III
MLRVVSWNIENLAPALTPGAPRRGSSASARPHLLEMHAALGMPDLFCLQEIRVRPHDAATIAAMTSALPGFACHYALCRDPYNGRFRGGRAYGVACYARDQLGAVPVAGPDWDREGRVCTLLFPSLSLLVVNVYGVNGSDRPHFDADRGHVDGDRHAFKRRFQADLLAYVRALRGHHRLLLLGDWNVSRAAIDTWPRLRTELPHALARAMFNETFLPALDVVDAFRELHPDERRYTWFNRMARPGTLDAARVDFMLLSRTLLPHVSKVSILDEPTQRYHSDHAPVQLDLRTLDGA